MFSIYQKIYRLDKHIRPKSFYDSMGEYHYYPLSSQQVKQLRLCDFIPGQWEKIIWDLDVFDRNHLQWLHRTSCISFSKSTLFLTSPHNIIHFSENILQKDGYEYFVSVYKCVNDATGEYIDLMSIMEQYKRNLRNNKVRNPSKKLPKYKYYLRRPHTVAEKRKHLSPEERYEYLSEYGVHIKERAKRNNLPTYYDDNHIHYDKCWKSQTKQRSQYNRNRKAKRKYNFGEFTRNYVEL